MILPLTQYTFVSITPNAEHNNKRNKPFKFRDLKKFTHWQFDLKQDLNSLFLLIFALYLHKSPNAALRCERRLAILERSENAKRCESLLNALLAVY